VVCVTWNVNSLRARLARVQEFLSEVKPDFLLLQETKCSPEQFPHEAIEAAGYRALDHSGGRWCGVAVLVPKSSHAELVATGLPGEPNPDEARWIEVRSGNLTVVSVYVPNGREVDSVHFDQKLEFLGAAAERAKQLSVDGDLLIGGDMNVAPRDTDVWDTKALEGSTHVTEPERAALRQLAAAGNLVDAHDSFLGVDDVQFTWWDYRGGSFHRGFGMRIDHFLASSRLADSIASCEIAREFRKGEKPSDHVPLVLHVGNTASVL